MTDIQYTSGVTVTIKAGPGYDSPWIVFHGTDPEHAFALLDEAQQHDLYGKVADAHNAFTGVELISRELGGRPVPQGPQGAPQRPQSQQGGYRPQGAPQGSQQGPSGPPAQHDLATHCRHGEKVYMSGISQKTNKPWFGFDCPQNYKTGECARFAKAAA